VNEQPRRTFLPRTRRPLPPEEPRAVDLPPEESASSNTFLPRTRAGGGRVTRVGSAEYDSDDDRFPIALTVLAILGGVVLVAIPLVLIGSLIDQVSP